MFARAIHDDTSTQNIVIFMPLGYIFRNATSIRMVIGSVFIALLVELAQYLSGRGHFDTFDALMYVVGMTIGYFIFKFIDVDLKS